MKLFRLLSAFLTLLFTVTAASAATVQFANPVVYNSGGQETNFVVAADVNGDGSPDMIVANTDGITVLLNNGDGTFAPPVPYPSGGTRAFAVAVADVNRDGLPDLVVTNYCLPSTGCTNGGVGVLLNDVNHPGSFLPPASYNAGGVDARAVVVGDVNNDGWPDIVVTSNCQALTCVDGSINLLLNNGDGTFKPPVNLGPSMGGPLAMGDMNGDGIPDLVAAGGVMLGNGDGTFTQVNPLVSGGSPLPGGTISIALADVNLDGILDVVVADQHTVKVQLGNGDGTLQDSLPYKSAGLRPLSVAVMDVNRDGIPDVVVANECTSSTSNNACVPPGTVGVLAGNGDGTFQAPVKYVSGGKIATSVVIADANHDTKPDIFVANTCVSASNCANGTVEVLFNVYKAAVTVQVGSSSNPSLVGQTVTFTATLVSGTPVDDGSPVNFFSGPTLIGTSSTAGGVASIAKSFAAYGNRIIKATYAGDFYHKAGSGQITQGINRNASITTVSDSPSTSTVGQKVTMTATVTSAGPMPTGTVQFFKNGTLLGSAPLSSGTASLTKAFMVSGTATITANYVGDSLTAPSTGSTTQTVN